MNLEPYPSYKDSGIEWIGEIPEGWEVHKLKYTSYVSISNVDKKVKEDETEALLCNYVDVYKNEFITSQIEFMKATASVEQITNLSIRKSKVIITKDSETADDIAVPALVKDELNGVVCGYHLALLKPSEDIIEGEYLFRQLQSKKVNDQFVINAHGVTRFGISTYPIKNAYVFTPPLPEQSSIAAFLDKKTAQIDEITAKNRRLIELLKEKRTALINQVVTKGLDPNAKMKDSGIEWIGEIPEGWEIRKLKFIADVILGQSPDGDELNGEEKGLPFFQGKAEFGAIYPTVKYWTTSPTKIAPENSVLISVRAPVGALNISNIRCCIGRGLASLNYQNNNYLYWVLHVLNYEINQLSTGSTFDAIGGDELKKLSLPFTKGENEQSAIAAFLDKKTAQIDKEIDLIEKKIDLLEEYRKSLIHHIVTGKYDVSGVET